MLYKLFWALQRSRSLIKTFLIPQRLGQWHFRTKKKRIKKTNKDVVSVLFSSEWGRLFFLKPTVTLEGFQGWRYELVSKGNFRNYYFYLWCKAQQTGSASGICRAPAQLLDLLKEWFFLQSRVVQYRCLPLWFACLAECVYTFSSRMLWDMETPLSKWLSIWRGL